MGNVLRLFKEIIQPAEETPKAEPKTKAKSKDDEPEKTVTTEEVMKGAGRDQCTPGEGVLTSQGNDLDTSTD